MTGPQAKVTIAADDSPLRQSLRDMLGKMKDFGDDAGKSAERASAPLAGLRDRFLGIAAIVGGGSMFGKVVADTAKLTEDSIELGKALGVSVNGARAWLAALDDAGASAQDLGAASRGLVKNLRENEAGLNAMGLATRDANGNLRPMTELMLDAIKLTNEYADGTDRQVAVAKFFGKAVEANSKLLNVNADSVRESSEAMRQLGVVIGEEDVAAFKAYDAATDRTKLTMQALMVTVGNALMPVLTKLSEWFNSVGPNAVTGLRVSVGLLVSLFWGLKNAVAIAWEVLNAMVFSVAEPIRSLASALYKLFTGDFKGAADEMLNWPERIGAAWSQAWAEMVKSSEESRDRITDLFVDGPEAAAPKGGDKNASVTRKTGKAAAAAPASYMQYYEAMLAEEKRVQATIDAGREYTKAQELAYWRFLVSNLELTGADRVAVLRKMSQLEVEIARQGRQQREAIDQDSVQSAEKLALAKVDAEASAARTAVELGQLTKAQLAQLEVQFEAQRFQIQSAALQERMGLLALDPDSNPVEMARIKNELLLLEQEHQTRRNTLISAAVRERSALGDAFAQTLGGEGSWQRMLDGMLMQAQTWQEALGGLFRQTGQVFLQELITKPAAAWLASLAKMLLVKLGFLSQEQTADAAASSAKIGMKGEEMGFVVGANAAEAGSGAAASQASIPYVGPVLALAAMAAIFAAVMSLGSKKSAAGGYDIPKGVNPMTQLHEEEMVLPSPLANAVRRMAEGGGASASQAPAMPPVELRGASAGEFFIAVRSDLLRVLNGAKRDFAWRG